MNLFALVSQPGGDEVARVPLDQALGATLEALFASQAADLVSGKTAVAYAAAFRPDEGEIAYIEGFETPPLIAAAIANPLTPHPLRLTGSGRIKGFFASVNTGQVGHPPLCFQGFDRRRLLSASGISLILGQGTYRRLEEDGLTLDSKLAALYQGTRLYLHSFSEARRVLELAHYYREATDEDLKAIARVAAVLVTDMKRLESNADQWVRRRVALIQDSQVLQKAKPSDIVKKAKEFDIAIETQKVGRQLKIVFPEDKQELKVLLSFLDDNYYVSSLTESKWVANSKRPAPTRAKTK